jgi:hypothetical protein
MALWGKQDGAALSQGTTLGVTNGSTAVTGSGTAFLSDIKNGDTLIIASPTTPIKYRVLSVTSNTALVLADNFQGTTNASLAIAKAQIQQSPKFVYQAAVPVTGSGSLAEVFGVDAVEAKVAANPKVASPGWVRVKTGTGGRSGRVTTEVLVAGRTLIAGDASDDSTFADT